MDTAVAGRRAAARRPGAIAAQLSRTRAKLRVEYLLAPSAAGPPTDRAGRSCSRCRAATGAASGELDIAGHLLSCDFCARAEPTLFDRRPAPRQGRREPGPGHGATPTW